MENVDALKDFKNTEKTVAFFYVSSDGTVVVRRSDDYIPKMIELSGGRYVFDDLTDDDSNTSAVKTYNGRVLRTGGGCRLSDL